MMCAKQGDNNGRSNTQFAFRWENFRSYQDTGWIQVRPITVLIGPNNSGKTSLFKPLLMLKQTIESRDPRITLKLSGPLANLGTYRDIVFEHSVDKRIGFHVRYSTPPDPRPARLGKLGSVPPGELSTHFRGGSLYSDIKLHKLDIRDLYGRELLTWEEAEGAYRLVRPTPLKGELGNLIRKSRPEHFLFPDTELLRNLMRPDRPQRKVVLEGDAGLYIGAMSWTRMSLRKLFSRLSYVGPLREYPRRFYVGGDEIPQSVGLRGENAPQTLFMNRDPGFSKQINIWVKQFGLADGISCQTVHQNIFRVSVSGPAAGTLVEFADAGFGLSQLLPLIVQGLHSDTGGIILCEQPEIHLNPKLQCTLANFFVDVALKGQKSILVETHSEHIVLRLRSLVAEGLLKPDQIGLYFVEKKDGKSTATQIPIARDGSISPDLWPTGFFEDALAEALKLARLPQG